MNDRERLADAAARVLALVNRIDNAAREGDDPAETLPDIRRRLHDLGLSLSRTS